MSLRIGIVGASGAGKTTKALELIRQLPRVVLLSPFVDDYALARPRTCASVREIEIELRKNWQRPFKLALSPAYGDEPTTLESVSALIVSAQRASGAGAPIALVVDELNAAFPVQALPRAFKSFGELCSRGRHYNVTLIGITQRMAEVSTRWRGNMSGFYTFRPADAVDVQTIGRMMPKGQAHQLASLQNFEYFYIESGRSIRGQVKRPRG
jgi:DNA helicase HerA-like ATPase